MLTPGDPALKGARALFDEQSGTICCEDAGEPIEQVLLIAHEIGHVVIHTTSSICATDDIDPARSTETAPVGLQRVEDYGIRERRELQANVFAREFLLPRPLARRFHLDESLCASAIADRLALPKSLIYQQLLDALLLPSSGSEATDSSPARPSCPDPSQDLAAAHRGSAYQLQAGPGTGKTPYIGKTGFIPHCRRNSPVGDPCSYVLQPRRWRTRRPARGCSTRFSATDLDRNFPCLWPRPNSPISR